MQGIEMTKEVPWIFKIADSAFKKTTPPWLPPQKKLIVWFFVYKESNTESRRNLDAIRGFSNPELGASSLVCGKRIRRRHITKTISYKFLNQVGIHLWLENKEKRAPTFMRKCIICVLYSIKMSYIRSGWQARRNENKWQ